MGWSGMAVRGARALGGLEGRWGREGYDWKARGGIMRSCSGRLAWPGVRSRPCA
jgi:hypothetical protein